MCGDLPWPVEDRQLRRAEQPRNLGWKWSIASDRDGVPIGWATDGANRHDIPLLAPTLDAVTARGLQLDIETLHLDRGYDANTVRDDLADRGIRDAIIARKRGDPKPAGSQPLRLGMRWAVEGPTRGCPTSVNSAATPTGAASTGSPSSRSRSP